MAQSRINCITCIAIILGGVIGALAGIFSMPLNHCSSPCSDFKSSKVSLFQFVDIRQTGISIIIPCSSQERDLNQCPFRVVVDREPSVSSCVAVALSLK